jgi:hypothetical protein
MTAAEDKKAAEVKNAADDKKAPATEPKQGTNPEAQNETDTARTEGQFVGFNSAEQTFNPAVPKTEEKPVIEKQKFYNQAAGIHDARGEADDKVGGPYYDTEKDKQWQEKHGKGTWAPSTRYVDEKRLVDEFNPHILPGDNALDRTKVEAKPVGEFDVVVGTETVEKSDSKTDDSL